MLKKLLTLLLLVPVIALAQTKYPYFQPGGALSCTGTCATQSVNVGSGAFITGALPNANLANPSLTINGTNIALGASANIALVAANFANPSGLIGLTAVNGVALTADRSDSAHALDQSISPTMTGNWLFRTGSGAGTEGIKIDNSAGDSRFGLYSAGTEYGILQTNTNQLNLAAVGTSTVMHLATNNGNSVTLAPTGNLTVAAPSASIHEIDTFGFSTAVVLGFQASGTTAGWLQFNDKTNANTVRGYMGFGSSLFTGAALADFGIASGGGALRLSSTQGASTQVLISNAGNVTVAAPSSGVDLTLNGIASSATAQLALVGGSNGSASLTLTDGQTGTRQWVLEDGNPAVGNLRIRDATRAADVMVFNNTGGVTIGAPASGPALNATAAANATAATFTGGVNSGNQFVVSTNAQNVAGLSSGSLINAGTNSSDSSLLVRNATGASTYWQVRGDGILLAPALSTSSAATTGTICWTTGTGLINVDTTTTCLLSSIRYKQAVLPLEAGLSELMRLRPVSYELKPQFDPDHLGRQLGLIAEEVGTVDPRLVALDDAGVPKGVRYQQLTALLTLSIQQQQHQIYILAVIIIALAIWLMILAVTLHRWRHRPV